MNHLFLIVIFILATLIGYHLIKNVPSLLHTPLMSGMNALSGITILGAICCVGKVHTVLGCVLCYAAIILAMINIASGFAVTARMLCMFHQEDRGHHK